VLDAADQQPPSAHRLEPATSAQNDLSCASWLVTAEERQTRKAPAGGVPVMVDAPDKGGARAGRGTIAAMACVPLFGLPTGS